MSSKKLKKRESRQAASAKSKAAPPSPRPTLSEEFARLRKEQESAAARKEAAIRQRAEAKQKANEEKAARMRRLKEERLAEHHAKAAKLQAKEAKSAPAADPHNAWWCDVAAAGCMRPCESHDYEPMVRYMYGDDYVTCEACFHAHLTEEQQESLERVEP